MAFQNLGGKPVNNQFSCTSERTLFPDRRPDITVQFTSCKYGRLAWPCGPSGPKDWFWRAAIDTSESCIPSRLANLRKEPPWDPSRKQTDRRILVRRLWAACFHKCCFWIDRKTPSFKTSPITASGLAATATINPGGGLPWRSVCKGAVKRPSH